MQVIEGNLYLPEGGTYTLSWAGTALASVNGGTYAASPMTVGGLWGVGLPAPALGAIATKKRGNSSWQGHTGLVVGANKDQVFLLGGNQSDAVNVAAFKCSEIVAYRWPAEVPLPAPHKLPTTIAGARSGVSEA